jgi:HEAT repeat protein
MNSLMIIALLAKMQDPTLTVAQRNNACYELRGVDAPEAVAGMRQSLGDGKVSACAGLNLRAVGAIEQFKGALSDQFPEVRALAARFLGSFEKPELLPLLAAAARDPQLLVATNAVEGLANYRDPVVVPYLLDLARSGGLVGAAALNRALQFDDPRVVGVARILLDQPDVSDRLAGMHALAMVGDASDLPKLSEIARKETEAVGAQGRGFGLMPAISLSHAAETTIEAIRKRL